MKEILLEGLYVLCGMISFVCGMYAFKDQKNIEKNGTALFWILLGIIFTFGKVLPPIIVGILIVFMGILSAFNKVKLGSFTQADENFRHKSNELLKNKLFIPALSIGLIAFLVASLLPELGGLVGLGIGSIIATILCLGITKSRPSYLAYDGSRLLQQIGAVCILSQLLAALGGLFKAAGVGEVIASNIAFIIPQGNHLAGVIAYCIGMAIFTIIMGNAFAAFAVITTGIGLPFVIAQGADPSIVGTLGLTAGYCGTLMTPMAANFNIVPAAILNIKNKNKVLFVQFPIACALLITHICLMYFWAF